MEELLGNVFLDKDGKQLTFDKVKGKTIGVYFWSHTCDICEGFSKALGKMYDDLQKYNFQVVAVTDIADDADEEGKNMQKAFSTAPWVTVPFDDEQGRHRLHDWAAGILDDAPSGNGPTLMIVSPTGELLNKRAMLYLGGGVSHVLNTGWRCPAVGDLSVGPFASDSDVAMSKVLVILAENCSKRVIEGIKTTLASAAGKLDNTIALLGSVSGVVKDVEKDIYTALGNGCTTWMRGWTSRAIRAWAAEDRCKTADTRPLMMLIDVSEFTDDERRGYYLSDATLITEDKVLKFLDDVEHGRVPRSSFNYDAYTEDFSYDAADGEEKPQVQPVSGAVNDGCYVGGTWDAFGIEGVSGSIAIAPADDASSASESEEYGESNAFLSQYKAEDVPNEPEPEVEEKPKKEKRRRPEDYIKVLEHLESVVNKQQETINMLERRIEALESSKKSVGWKIPEEQQATTSAKSAKGVWRSEDDEDTDSDDSEVAAYRAQQAAKQAATSEPSSAPDTKQKWRSEDDDDTDSEDSKVKAYRAKQAAKNTTVEAPAEVQAEKPEKRPWKSEDDDDTDSEDSEVLAYRAQQEAKKKAASGDKPNEKENVQTDESSERPPLPTETDWTCGQCFQFNWADAASCTGCGVKRN
eukprot:TRINITY_DN12082_c0_g1_i1.p1 TRINITY_DN12082_c0_g1~~TRINITY_DN12082_c0_g1_i1.p1  ORF type:complete len:712 (+),score=180.07 TRINITY_DN12082_c0_g1_i1:231-2138(+)